MASLLNSGRVFLGGFVIALKRFDDVLYGAFAEELLYVTSRGFTRVSFLCLSAIAMIAMIAIAMITIAIIMTTVSVHVANTRGSLLTLLFSLRRSTSR